MCYQNNKLDLTPNTLRLIIYLLMSTSTPYTFVVVSVPHPPFLVSLHISLSQKYQMDLPMTRPQTTV